MHDSQGFAHVAHEPQALRLARGERDGPHALHLGDEPLDLLLLRRGHRAVHAAVEAVPDELADVLAADEPRVRAAEPPGEVVAEARDAIVLEPEESLEVLAPVGVRRGVRPGLVAVAEVPPVHEPG